MHTSEYIAHLLVNRLAGINTAEEEKILEAWTDEHGLHGAFVQTVQDDQVLAKQLAEFMHGEQDRAVVFERVQRAIQPPRMAHRIHFLKTAWFRYAAVLVLIFGIGAYLWNTNNTKDSLKPVVAASAILPGTEKAVLTLSDGRAVVLDSTTGRVLTDGDVQIDHSAGGLRYSQQDVVVMNTMTTPKGGQYHLTLADGTEVWLNAASSITFPTAFKSGERVVSVSGEVYFTVAKNARRPFVVRTPSDSIMVLGTEFNVNAYADEPVMKTSLVNGSIKVNDVVMRPGQAVTNGQVQPTNLSQDIAWRKGVFNFTGLPFQQAMRQLARWYDVDIVYEGVITPVELIGDIRRDLTLQEVISGLNKIGDVELRLDGRTLHVRTH